MSNEKLRIIPSDKSTRSNPKTEREAARDYFEKKWQQNPEQFDSGRNAMERERIARTWKLIEPSFPLQGKKVAYLGCGTAPFLQQLLDQGAIVDVVDVAETPLEKIRQKQLKEVATYQDYLPFTTLHDGIYSLVLSTEVIAYLRQDKYRLFVSELARLVDPQGHMVCSTPLDIYSVDALQRFANLIATEFEVTDWIFSYHSYTIRLLHWLKAPERYYKAGADEVYRNKELEKQRWALPRFWFRLNSYWLLAKGWGVVSFILRPLIERMAQSQALLLFLEKICRALSGDSGISHVIARGTRRPLWEPSKERPPLPERKGRKEVWE